MLDYVDTLLFFGIMVAIAVVIFRALILDRRSRDK